MSEETGMQPMAAPQAITETVEADGGPSGLSDPTAAAVARQIERDSLGELISAAEAEHGPIAEKEIRAVRDRLRRARREADFA